LYFQQGNLEILGRKVSLKKAVVEALFVMANTNWKDDEKLKKDLDQYVRFR
jgi:hypothetical protein